MTFIFCDDNKIFLDFFIDKVAGILRNIDAKARLISCTDSAELITYIKNNHLDQTDAIFLDIEMPGVSGFDIASLVNSSAERPSIIFVSNMDDMVYESFEYQPYWFLRKSDMDKLPALIEKLVLRAATRERFYVFRHNDSEKYSLPLDDILYFESCNHELIIHTNEKTYSQRQTITNAAFKTEPYFFVRCHASFLVNCRHIASISRSNLLLDNSIKIPISRSRRSDTEAAYINYIRSTIQPV